jgi:aminoglycoside phosphotransferase (APT) family kinase protein
VDPADPTRRSTAWLKQVPWFFAHEATVLRWLNAEVPAAAPTLLASADEGRMLLDDLPGEDRYGADPSARDRMLAELHAVQVRAVDAAGELAAAGVPDRRGSRLAARVREVVDRHGAGIPGLGELVDGLDERLSAVDSCGLPDTLVHGDFHAGNVRAKGDGPPSILDWGDAFIGNPAFDALRMTDDLPAAEPLLAAWCRRWRDAVPGCDPGPALTLLRPVAALLGAATYADFVDRIEPAERLFHAGDVVRALRAAVG